eukprot:1102935-Amphidinium_carterae.1
MVVHATSSPAFGWRDPENVSQYVPPTTAPLTTHNPDEDAYNSSGDGRLTDTSHSTHDDRKGIQRDLHWFISEYQYPNQTRCVRVCMYAYMAPSQNR